MTWVNGFNQINMYYVLPFTWTNATVFNLERAVLNSNTTRFVNSNFSSHKLSISFRLIISCFKASFSQAPKPCFQCFCKAAGSYLPSCPCTPDNPKTLGCSLPMLSVPHSPSSWHALPFSPSVSYLLIVKMYTSSRSQRLSPPWSLFWYPSHGTNFTLLWNNYKTMYLWVLHMTLCTLLGFSYTKHFIFLL